MTRTALAGARDSVALARRPLREALHSAERVRYRAGISWRFRGRFSFDDRRAGRDRAAIVLAGHKEYLWRSTLPRLARFAPDDVDVCIVTPGVAPAAIRELAERQGWSYLSTEENNVSLAQNLAIRSHPDARLIFKIDEDIFIGSTFFDGLADGYERATREGTFRVGLCAPVLNVNGFTYVDFLRTLGLDEEYRRRFGELRRAADGIRAHADGEAAVWLWEHSLPLDETAARFAALPFSYATVPHRFSTGAILFERDLWERMEGFRRPVSGPGLGTDEAHICESCVLLSRVMVVVANVFAGHFSFAPQTEMMRRAYGDRLAEL